MFKLIEENSTFYISQPTGVGEPDNGTIIKVFGFPSLTGYVCSLDRLTQHSLYKLEYQKNLDRNFWKEDWEDQEVETGNLKSENVNKTRIQGTRFGEDCEFEDLILK